MPLFAMISSCNMLFDSSKHCNLMLFLLSLWICYFFAILPCPFELVLVISGDSSVFMFCHALPIHHVHAFFLCWGIVAYFYDTCNMPSCCFGQIVAMSCLECMCCTVAPFWACSIWTCLVWHVVSYYHVASLFWGVCLMFGCILHQCHV